MTVTTTALHPQRLALRLSLVTPIADLEPAIGVFHRCLQRGWLEGALLDVADYRHVPQGPGVMLVGHDVDLGLEHEALVLVRKRSAGDDAAAQLSDLLRMAAVAVSAFAYDGTLDVDVDLGRPTVTLLDRALAADLGDAAVEALAAAVAPALDAAYGTAPDVAAIATDDPRHAPALRADVGGDVSAADLVERLGGSRAPGQSAWDISVEEFADLRGQDDVVVLDVREPSEYETVNLGGTLLPLAELPDRIDEVPTDRRVVVHCRAGWRGGKAVTLLREQGIEAWNVNGALVAWADRIDATTTRY